MERYCADRSAEYEWRVTRAGGGAVFKQCFLYGSPELAPDRCTRAGSFHPQFPGGVMALYPRHGWSFIRIPGEDFASGCLRLCCYSVLLCCVHTQARVNLHTLHPFVCASPQQQHELLWEKSNDQKKKSIFLGFIKRWISSFRLKGEPGARGRMFRGQHGVSRGRAGHITLFRHCLSICQAANPSQSCKAAEIMGCRRRSGTQTPSSHFHHGSGAGWPGYV